MKKAVIIGGGISGLAAGVLLSESGYKVELYESQNHLGGRAYSFTDKNSGLLLDNGQHIMMGCYHHTFKFLKQIGSYDKLYIQQNLYLKYCDINRNYFTLDCRNRVAPFHIISGLRKLPFISNSDLLRFARLGLKIYFHRLFNNVTDESAEDILSATGQRKEIVESLWKPIIISAMNAKPGNVSGGLFADTMYELFFKNNRNSNIVLPTVGLSQLFSEPAAELIIKNDGEIFINDRIVRVENSGKQITALYTAQGKKILGDIFISSIPPHNLLRFPELNKFLDLSKLSRFKYSPIIGFYLLLKKAVITDKILFLLKTKIQVLFNKSKICNLESRHQLLSLIISAADEQIHLDGEALKTIIIDELSRILPDFSGEDVLYFKYIKERRATPVIDNITNSIRPNPTTGFNNFFLIGDWTNTGLPATIESAVKSAYDLKNILSVL